MKLTIKLVAIITIIGMLLAQPATSAAQQTGEEWIPLFDGESLNNWRASENTETFSVKDGMIAVDGPRAHLFYIGTVQNHHFTDFELKVDVKTTEGSNSGIYFHTEYQEKGWPAKGYEVQVNNTHDDPRKTASLYGVEDVMNDAPADDGKWFTIYIKVQGNQITTKVNGETMVEYTDPKQVDGKGRLLSAGTFALQGHDPGSTVYYKNIIVHPID